MKSLRIVGLEPCKFVIAANVAAIFEREHSTLPSRLFDAEYMRNTFRNQLIDFSLKVRQTKRCIIVEAV